MYTSIEIKGFRCFKHLKIDKLARINLIGGKNNTGKTALLEALGIWAAATAAPDPVIPDLYRLRFGSVANAAMLSLGFADLFRDFAEEEGACVSLRSEDDGEVQTILRCEVPAQTEREVTSTAAEEGALAPASTGPRVPSKCLSIDCGDRHGSFTILSDGHLLGFHNRALPIAPSLLLASGSRLDQTFLADRLTRLHVLRRKDSVVGVLSILEPALTGLDVGYQGGQPVLHAEVGGARPVPLPLLGEGMVKVASLMVSLQSLEGGMLLVDEIENGLHYSVMPDVWRAIAQAAADLGVQVFATTHSHECVEAAAEAVEGAAPGNFLYHRLDRVGEEVKCRTYSPRGLEIAVKTGTEFR